LYYLGGLVPDEQDKDLFVHSKGRPFRVPPVGEFIEMEMHHAQDLIQRGHNGVHSVWSLSARDAEMAKSGKLFRDPTTLIDPNELSIEDLERMLRERRGEVEAEQKPSEDEAFMQRLREIAATDDDEDEPVVDDEPPVAPVAEAPAETPAPARRRNSKSSNDKKEEATN